MNGCAPGFSDSDNSAFALRRSGGAGRTRAAHLLRSRLGSSSLAETHSPQRSAGTRRKHLRSPSSAQAALRSERDEAPRLCRLVSVCRKSGPSGRH